MEADTASHEPATAIFLLRPDDDDPRPRPAAEIDDAWADRQLLDQNAAWFCRLRWLVAGLLSAAGIAGLLPDGFERIGLRLTPAWPLSIAAVLVLLNGAYALLSRRLPVRPLLWVQILVDLVVLTVVIHFLGSTTTYAPFMYLFHIILACIFFTRRESAAVTVAAAMFYLGCLLAEFAGMVAPTTVLAAPVPALVGEISGGIRMLNVASVFAIWAVIWYLASRLAGELRQRERQLALANQRLKASSDERARHMLQTTHQLKAPFAAIHAHTQLLSGGYCGPLSEQAQGVVAKITARCGMLSQQIQEMLQLANLRSESQSNPPAVEIDLDAVVRTAAARIELAAAQRGIQIETQVEAVRITAAEDHVRMLVDNLLSNAVNYSDDGGAVAIACRRLSDQAACLEVRDHGIGIPADKLPHIFDDYFRTAEAARHNKASTGLGLAIVRHVARAVGITVRVESAPGQGTCFTLTIPRVCIGAARSPRREGVA